MNEELELVRCAIFEGDGAALNRLMLIGQQHAAAYRFEDASRVFRAAANAYRLRAEDTERRSALEREVYQKWFEMRLCELCDWSSQAHKIDDECIRRVVVEELCADEFGPIFAYLEKVLTGLGMEFYSPGGSVTRRVWILLAELFGVREPSKYLDQMAVRVGLEQLASEVVKRSGGLKGG